MCAFKYIFQLSEFKDLARNQLAKHGLYLLRKPTLACLTSEKIVSYTAVEDVPNKIIDEIFDFYQNIPVFYDAKTQKHLQIAGAWKKILKDTRINQIKFIEHKDKRRYTRLLNRLFYNELSQGLWNYEYYFPSIEKKYIVRQFIEEALIYEKITSRNASFLASDKSWSHWGAKTEAGIIKYPSINHGIQAFNLQNLIDTFDIKDREKPVTILDLGSGWGGMSEYLLRSEITCPFSIFSWIFP